MPRNIPTDALTELAKTTGVEPVNIIRIEWVKSSGNFYYYADRAIADAPEIQGKLIALDGLEAVLSIDKGTSSTSVKIQLNDTDGTIKDIFNYNDIHNRNVVIYQWFVSNNFSINYKFPIFEGVIATPIEWSEGSRIISFDVMSSLDSREVGFSVEDGDFANVPAILLGKSWPLVFGMVLDMPTVRMDDTPTGTTRIPLSIPDYNLKDHISFIDGQANSQAGKATCLSLRSAELFQIWKSMLAQEVQSDSFLGGTGSSSTITSTSGSSGGSGFTNINNQEQSLIAFNRAQKASNSAFLSQSDAVYNRAKQLECQALQMLNNVNSNIIPKMQEYQARFNAQKLHDVNVIPIINGHKFHQGTEIEIKINNAIFTGVFNYDNFIVSTKQAPKDFQRNTNGALTTPQNNFVPNFNNATTVCSQEGDRDNSDAYWACEPPYFMTFGGLDSFNNPNKKEASERGEPWFAQAGASVSVGNNYSIRYILSIMPGTVVHYLSSMKTNPNSNLKVLTRIPEDYYTIGTLTLGSVVATIATFHQPLSTIGDDNYNSGRTEDWDDDVFATISSSIGPNVIDILIWLITTYTEKDYDPTSFTHVRALLGNYPANFPLLEKKNVIDLLKEIAWQSRCSIWISQNTFFIKYLPEQATSVDTITEDHIEFGGSGGNEFQSLVITTTPTEELVTKLIATWKNSYAISEKNKIILTYNINKYGVKEESFDFYIYNTAALVEKSATFWLIRLANVWKKINCRCILTKLKLETMDNATIDFNQNYVYDIDHPLCVNGVVGVIEKATFDSDNFNIDIDMWLPIRLGEMIPYDAAYPYAIAIQYLWPTVEDIAGGFTNDTPQAIGANGNLSGRTGQTTSQGGRTRQTRPSDNADTSNTINGQPSTITSTGPGTVFNNPITPDRVYPKQNNLTYSLTTPPTLTPRVGEEFIPNLSDHVYPGYITGPNENDEGTGNISYNAIIFPNGLEEEGFAITNVIVINLDEDEEIEANTWGTFYEQTEYHGEQIITRYYFEFANPTGVDGVFPGQITGLNEDEETYTATIYPNGLDEAGQELDTVYILQLDTDDEIEADTWGFIHRLTETHGVPPDDTTETNYYFQPAIWT